MANTDTDTKDAVKDVTVKAKSRTKKVTKTNPAQALCVWAGLVQPSWSDKLQVVKEGEVFQVQVDLEFYRGSRGTCQHWLAALRSLALSKGWSAEFKRNENNKAYLEIRKPETTQKEV